PLFALPGGAGNALEYRFLAEALGPEQPVAVVEMRGMHTPGPPDRTVDAKATHVVAEVEARLAPDDPCVILGFSGGGPTAYETAQRLFAGGRTVHLVLLDSAPTTKGRQKGRRREPELTAAEQRAAMLALPTIRTASLKELPDAVL